MQFFRKYENFCARILKPHSRVIVFYTMEVFPKRNDNNELIIAIYRIVLKIVSHIFRKNIYTAKWPTYRKSDKEMCFHSHL